MTKTKISDLGSSVCVDDQNEEFIPALGNGSAVPGDMCYIDPSNGRLLGVDEGAADLFGGILMESKITGTETAIVTDIPCKLVVPKSGHKYRVRTLPDASGATTDLQIGQGMDFSATAYKVDKAASINVAVMTLTLVYIDNDEVAEINWR